MSSVATYVSLLIFVDDEGKDVCLLLKLQLLGLRWTYH